MRHRLRAIQLKHWKRGTTIYRELRALGASPEVAAPGGGQHPPLVAQQRHAPQVVLHAMASTGSGYPVSPDLNFSNRPVRTRMPGGVAGERSVQVRPLCRSTRENVPVYKFGAKESA